VSGEQRTLADVYRDRPLSNEQLRRVAVLLRLTEPRSRSDAGVAAPTPRENHQSIA
jgi:hypothetical protein